MNRRSCPSEGRWGKQWIQNRTPTRPPQPGSRQPVPLRTIPTRGIHPCRGASASPSDYASCLFGIEKAGDESLIDQSYDSDQTHCCRRADSVRITGKHPSHRPNLYRHQRARPGHELQLHRQHGGHRSFPRHQQFQQRVEPGARIRRAAPTLQQPNPNASPTSGSLDNNCRLLTFHSSRRHESTAGTQNEQQ
jgi:hypothetical protein